MRKAPTAGGVVAASTRWFAALERFDRAVVEAMVAEGFDINTRDKDGWTALFYATGPWGGDPALTQWLLEHGADPAVKDHEGRDPVEAGAGWVSSALEANMLAGHRRMLDEAKAARAGGKRARAKAKAKAKASAKAAQAAAPQVKAPPAKPAASKAPAPATPSPASRKARDADFLGRFVVASGGAKDQGQQVRVTRTGLVTPLSWLQLDGARWRRTGDRAASLDGEHRGELVHVALTLRDDGGLDLSWSDGLGAPASVVLRRA